MTIQEAIKQCKTCGITIVRQVKWSTKQWEQKLFCSPDCQRIGRDKTRCGPKKGTIKWAKPKKCSVCPKVNHRVVYYKKFDRLLCDKHAHHFLKYGKMVKTIYDRNEILVNEDFCEMKLLDRKMNFVGVTVFDKCILEEVRRRKWCLRDKYGYVRSSGQLYLHHLALSKRKDFVVDHINGNTLDNRRINLRYLTSAENMRLGRKNVDEFFKDLT